MGDFSPDMHLGMGSPMHSSPHLRGSTGYSQVPAGGHSFHRFPHQADGSDSQFLMKRSTTPTYTPSLVPPSPHSPSLASTSMASSSSPHLSPLASLSPGLGTPTSSSSSSSSSLVPSSLVIGEGAEDAGGWVGLDMTRMGLRNLSLRLGIYQHLSMLYLSNNQLTSFPGALCTKLKNLTLIDLSNNLLVSLPSEIGCLLHLKHLMLYNNRITELPLEMGRLFKLETLHIEHNNISSPAHAILAQGAQKIVTYLRDRLEPPPPPPKRTWTSYVEQESYKGSHHAARSKLKVMAYNVLADSYATPERYAHCPAWALTWSYRKEKILKEIVEYSADLICLQEVETGEFQEFFLPSLAKLGYHGLFKPKSRAYVVGVNTSKVDGCAMFYRTSRFSLVQDTVIEFQRLALARHNKLVTEDNRTGHERLLSRDNIALVAIFDLIEEKPPPAASGRSARGQKSSQQQPPQKVIVCTTHIHWNPELKDVKLMQTQMMMEELMTLRNKLRYDVPNGRLAPMIICGDFNSEPDSGVYELLSRGDVPSDHPDFGEYRYGIYSQQGLKHNIPLISAYNPTGVGEPPFTNYTAQYVGVLDYIFVSKDTVRPSGIAEHVSRDIITSQGYALPSPHFPSDHLPLIAELELL